VRAVPPKAGYRVRRVIGTHERDDMAFLEVEPPNHAADAPVPLTLASGPPTKLEGQQVYLVGYPIRDPRRNEPEHIARLFRDVYNIKRVQPGVLRGPTPAAETQLLQHDCAMLGHSGGACLFDLETHQVLGMHLAGRYLEPGNAFPIWLLRDNPVLKHAGLRSPSRARRPRRRPSRRSSGWPARPSGETRRR
jgi:hypothetical protein